MNQTPIENIPVNKIRVVNPRTRNKVAWQGIVGSIEAVGLKKPITVFRRPEPDAEGNLYDLVCGQGRLEAVRKLGEADVPAIVTEAARGDRQLMSLIENIARRPPSNRSIYFEVKKLRERGYSPAVIGRKLGIDRSYIHGIARLVECGEAKLIAAVEAGRLPITVAMEIAIGSSESVQRTMVEGYENGSIRGTQMRSIRRLLEQRSAESPSLPVPSPKPLTGPGLARLYREQVQEQQKLVVKADLAEERLAVIASAMKVLVADEDLLTLLRTEGLFDMPEQLAARIA